jgi:iron complex transport system ATP-binding protein
MIARALAQDPHIIVLDEPTAFLDLPRRIEIMGLLKKLTRDTRKAVLLSTHDLDLALQVADIMWLISDSGELKVGAPEDLVLSGVLEESFNSHGVEFDKWHGTFIMHRTWRGTVNLVGSGIAKVWTKKALEREGYKVQSGLKQDMMTISCPDREDGWTITDGEKTETFRSLYDLVRALRAEDV